MPAFANTTTHLDTGSVQALIEEKRATQFHPESIQGHTS
jgi:anthranilate/para-aminobenzoate synthase component II